MDSTPAPSPAKNPPGLVCAIACAALLAGTLDYTAAITNFLINGGKDPTRIAWYIASALLGREAALAGGWVTATLGIGLHYLVATIWTVFYFLIYPRIPALGRYPFSAACIYGLFVWAVMNLVVVPLSRIAKVPFNPTNAAIQAAILIVCIGLPISLLARRFYAKT